MTSELNDQIINICAFILAGFSIWELRLIFRTKFSDNLSIPLQLLKVFFAFLMVNKFYNFKNDIASTLTESFFLFVCITHLIAILIFHSYTKIMFQFIKNQIQKIKNYFSIKNHREPYKYMQKAVNRISDLERRKIVQAHLNHYTKPVNAIKIAGLKDTNFKD